MLLSEKNIIIINKIQDLINKRGYGGRLFLEDIPNTAKRRPRYFVDKDGLLRFSVFLWEVNKLEGVELENELNVRVNDAIKHFKNEGKL